MGQFLHEAELEGIAPEACAAPGYNGTALGYDCPLFARKFPRETASAVYNLFRSCTTGLNVTNSGLCADGAADIPDQRVSNALPVAGRREFRRERARRMLGQASRGFPGWPAEQPRREEQGWL